MNRKLLPLGFWIAFAALCACAALSCGTARSGTDGVTHFLKLCSESSECGSLGCVCGVCTETCNSSSVCQEFHDQASCQFGSAVCRSGPAPAVRGVCTLSCDNNTECAGNGSPMVCQDHRCVQAKQLADLSDKPTPAATCESGSACTSLSCAERQVARRIDGDCCVCDAVPECGSGAPVVLEAAAIAERLAQVLYGQAADDALVAAAVNADLTVSGQVGCFAREMLTDRRAAVGVGNYFERWFGSQTPAQLFEAPDSFAEYSPELEAALREEVKAYGAAVVLDGDGAFASLYTGQFAFVNQASAPLYGLSGINSAELRKVELPQKERAGILTRGFFLAANGRDEGLSLVIRGAAARRTALCQAVQPAPPTVPQFAPEPGVTAREQMVRHIENPACAACHRLSDPFGYALEHFDGRGIYRSELEGRAIDASGTIVAIDGTEELAFDTPAELMQLLASSAEAQECAAEQWLRYALDDDPLAFSIDRDVLDTAKRALRLRGTLETGFNLREVIAGAAETELFLTP